MIVLCEVQQLSQYNENENLNEKRHTKLPIFHLVFYFIILFHAVSTEMLVDDR